MSKSNELLGAMIVGAIVAVIIVAPNVYRSYVRAERQHQEFLNLELNSLKSEFQICDVINNSDRADFKDIMRDVCEKNLKRQEEIKSQIWQ